MLERRVARHVKRGSALRAIAIVAMLAIGVSACGDDSSDSADGGPVVVTESGPVTLQVGQELVAELESNPTTGFSWTVASISDEDVLESTGDDFVEADDTGVVGAGGQQQLTFVALAEGTTEVELVYARPFEPDVDPAESVELLVTVE